MNKQPKCESTLRYPLPRVFNKWWNLEIFVSKLTWNHKSQTLKKCGALGLILIVQISKFSCEEGPWDLIHAGKPRHLF